MLTCLACIFQKRLVRNFRSFHTVNACINTMRTGKNGKFHMKLFAHLSHHFIRKKLSFCYNSTRHAASTLSKNRTCTDNVQIITASFNVRCGSSTQCFFEKRIACLLSLRIRSNDRCTAVIIRYGRNAEKSDGFFCNCIKFCILNASAGINNAVIFYIFLYPQNCSVKLTLNLVDFKLRIILHLYQFVLKIIFKAFLKLKMNYPKQKAAVNNNSCNKRYEYLF